MKYILSVSVVINLILIGIAGVFTYLFFVHKVGFITPQVTQQIKTSTVNANQTYTLPLAKGDKATPLSLTVITVQKTTKIQVGTKDLTTKNGKAFLVVNTLMLNKSTKQIQANASDYVRLMQNGQPTEALYKSLTGTIAANDSYSSGMVFLVDNTQNSFTLSVGDNVGQAQQLPINF